MLIPAVRKLTQSVYRTIYVPKPAYDLPTLHNLPTRQVEKLDRGGHFVTWENLEGFPPRTTVDHFNDISASSWQDLVIDSRVWGLLGWFYIQGYVDCFQSRLLWRCNSYMLIHVAFYVLISFHPCLKQFKSSDVDVIPRENIKDKMSHAWIFDSLVEYSFSIALCLARQWRLYDRPSSSLFRGNSYKIVDTYLILIRDSYNHWTLACGVCIISYIWSIIFYTNGTKSISASKMAPFRSACFLPLLAFLFPTRWNTLEQRSNRFMGSNLPTNHKSCAIEKAHI